MVQTKWQEPLTSAVEEVKILIQPFGLRIFSNVLGNDNSGNGRNCISQNCLKYCGATGIV